MRAKGDLWSLTPQEQEFLAACGIRRHSANASPYGLAFAGGAGEGPRRIIFDVENISEHEKVSAPPRDGADDERAGSL